MYLVCSFSLMVDFSHELIVVAVITAVGYDYGALQAPF